MTIHVINSSGPDRQRQWSFFFNMNLRERMRCNQTPSQFLHNTSGFKIYIKQILFISAGQ